MRNKGPSVDSVTYFGTGTHSRRIRGRSEDSVGYAIDATVDFLKAIGVERRVFSTLSALSCAVDDLRYGIIDPGIKAAPFSADGW